jgi:hypothetical protein
MALFSVKKERVERETEKGILAEVDVPIIVPRDGAYEVQVVQRKGWIPKAKIGEYGRIDQDWLRQQYDNPLFNPANRKKKNSEETKEAEPTEYVEF